MCGRFALYSPARKLEHCFRAKGLPASLKPSWNIAPTHEIVVVIQDTVRRLERFRWGLVPPWAKKISGNAPLINARTETLSQKPAFRDAFRKRRCLIPADGFYEWSQTDRTPFYIFPPEQIPFAFAGLWEIREDRTTGTSCLSCTIITTESSPALRPVHSRMPVILSPAYYDLWLDPMEANSGTIFAEGIVNDLRFYPVSPRVNSVRNNDPACIAPAGRREIQLKI